jgi:hypothetical protein
VSANNTPCSLSQPARVLSSAATLWAAVHTTATVQTFPGSDWVTSQAALAHYNCRNFDTAQALYEDLLERDPWRLQVSQGAGGGGAIGTPVREWLSKWWQLWLQTMCL